MSAILGNSGTPHSILGLDGVRYTFRLIDQKALDEFQKRVYEMWKDAAFLTKEMISEELYLKRLDEASDRYIEGEFSFFSPRGKKYLATVPGILFLLSLISDCDMPQLVGLMTGKGPEMMNLLRLIIRESFPGIPLEKVPEPAPKKDEYIGPIKLIPEEITLGDEKKA